MDLTIYPIRPERGGRDSRKNIIYGIYGNFELDKDRRIFEQIGDVGKDPDKIVIETKPLRRGAWFYNEEGEETRNDGNDKPITTTTAGELTKVVVPEDATHWNKAIFAFFSCLPPEMKVVLIWANAHIDW